jgi:ABC-type phosphate/phosphonate transport system substrate-binding protein
MIRFGACLLLAATVIFPLTQTLTEEPLKGHFSPPRALNERQKQPEGLRASASIAKTETLTLGIAAANVKKKIAEHQDFVNYLTRRLFSRADLKGTVMVVPTPLQLAQLLIENKVDFFMDSAYPTYIVSMRAGSRPILRRWKHGVSEYRSVIFTRRDSGIHQLTGLLGKIIVFEDPDSTSGYFLPKSLLAGKGLELRQKASLSDYVSPKEIGFVFAGGSERNIREWVLSRKAAAGAFSDDNLERTDSKSRAELFVLAESDKLPRHLVSVRKELPRGMENFLQDIMLGMHQDPEGLRILRKTDNTTKFDLLDGSPTEMQVKLLDLFFSRSTK